MIVYKTHAGRAALNERSKDLSSRQRQAVILANGQRSAQELCSMLGEDGAEILGRLIQQGLLAWVPPDVASPIWSTEDGSLDVVHRQVAPLTSLSAAASAFSKD